MPMSTEQADVLGVALYYSDINSNISLYTY